MGRMGRTALAAVLAAGILGGCSDGGRPELPAACLEGPDAVARALERAPGAVTLAGGTALSECVAAARTSAELQSLGIVLTQVAERLEASLAAEPRAALRLGYLVGAARRGAGRGSGVQDELVRRLERSGALEGLPAASERALLRGLRAGEAGG